MSANGDNITPVPNLLPEEAFLELSPQLAVAELYKGLRAVSKQITAVSKRFDDWDTTFENRNAAAIALASEETASRMADKLLKDLTRMGERVDKVEDKVADARASSPTINNYLTKPDSEAPKSLPVPKELKPYVKRYHTWIALFLLCSALVTWGVKQWAAAMADLAKVNQVAK